MISKESIAEMKRMNEQLDNLEERLAKLFVKVNKYIKKKQDTEKSSRSKKITTDSK